jgi:hypothetical protein
LTRLKWLEGKRGCLPKKVIRVFWTALFVGFVVCLAIWFMAQFARERRDRKERAAFIASLSPAERERLKGFETVKGDWREFRDVLHR